MPPKRPSTYSAASQGPSQRRRAQPASPSPDSDSEDDDEDDVQVGGGGGRSEANDEEGDTGTSATQSAKGGLNDTEVKAKAGQLVRYALFHEYRRAPLRRTEIVKNVIPKNPRAYNVVFARAQTILRTTLGCELYELRPRNKGEAVRQAEGGATQTQTQTQTQAQTQRKKGKGRARQLDVIQEDEEEEEEDEDVDEIVPATQTQRATKGAGSKTYILRSTLPSQLLAAMSNPAPFPMGVQEDDDPEDSGALINWEKGDGTSSGHVGLLGVRTVILSIVMCLGRVVTDDHLHALLRRLNLQRETIIPYVTTDSNEPRLTLDKYLEVLAKQSYLEKIKLPGPVGNADAGVIEWRWGNREAEFPEKAAAEFIEEIMMGREGDTSGEESEEEGPRRGGRNGNGNGRARAPQGEEMSKEAKRKKLREDIVKAAGGVLVGAD
ncbi:hypothetical protein IAR55_006959 [Kwoniella newhampshirensis]|uniref:MAGE domain-containing protein n=1 Tax=Kwoniella newhampshirensis TaxID=1651941 RepID=A0AAW0YTM8_9TREE